MTRGDEPKRAMLVPDATPLYLGNVEVAANTVEKYLDKVNS